MANEQQRPQHSFRFCTDGRTRTAGFWCRRNQRQLESTEFCALNKYKAIADCLAAPADASAGSRAGARADASADASAGSRAGASVDARAGSANINHRATRSDTTDPADANTTRC